MNTVKKIQLFALFLMIGVSFAYAQPRGSNMPKANTEGIKKKCLVSVLPNQSSRHWF